MPREMAEAPRYALVVYRDQFDIGCIPISDAQIAHAKGTVFVFASEADILPAFAFNTPRIATGDDDGA